MGNYDEWKAYQSSIRGQMDTLSARLDVLLSHEPHNARMYIEQILTQDFRMQDLEKANYGIIQHIVDLLVPVDLKENE